MPHTPLKIAFRRPWPGTLRGLILWEFSWAFVLIGGIQFVGTVIPEPTRTYLSFALALTGGRGIPLGIMFITLGVFCAFTSYCHFNRDRFGYLAASVLTGTWGLGYVCGWLFYDAPVRSVGAGLVWLLFCAVLTTCARLPRLPFDFAEARHDG